MINNKRIAVVLPAYNAENTLEATIRELPDVVDIRILVDDHSSDRTVEVARRLGLRYFVHDRNYGYGRNQQTCYREALSAGADVVIMVHPDYQYTPLLVTAMAFNRLLTAFENMFLGVKLSEYHTGYRAFSRDVLTKLPLVENSDDFVFDVRRSISKARRPSTSAAVSPMGLAFSRLRCSLRFNRPGWHTFGSSTIVARGWRVTERCTTPAGGLPER